MATPTSVFLTEGETKEVLVSAIDDQGDPLPITLEASNVGAGITVVRDENYLPTTAGGQIQGTTRFLVTANTFVGTSFQVVADGQTLTVPVRSLPATFAAQFSNPAPALGEPVTLTAPAGLRFGATTGITFPGAAGEPAIVGISADSTVLTFLPAPGTDTTALVSGIEATYAVGVPLDTLETTSKITTPAVTEIPANFSSTSPAVNAPVVVTASGFSFLPSAVVVFNDIDTATVVDVAADGSSMSFLANPGTTGIPTISGTVLDILPTVPLTLPATTTVTVSSTVPALAGTNTPGTAPTVTVPAAGGTSIVYDKGTFTAPDISIDEGVGAQYYKLVVTDTADYTFTVNWDAATDLDMVLCSDAACSDGGAFLGTGVDQPETDTVTLEPGTYYFDAVLFAGPAPGWVSLKITHELPAE